MRTKRRGAVWRLQQRLHQGRERFAIVTALTPEDFHLSMGGVLFDYRTLQLRVKRWRHMHGKNNPYQSNWEFIVYDTGLSSEQRQHLEYFRASFPSLKEKPGKRKAAFSGAFDIRDFLFDRVPTHISNFRQSSMWIPLIISETLAQFDLVLYLSSNVAFPGAVRDNGFNAPPYLELSEVKTKTRQWGIILGRGWGESLQPTERKGLTDFSKSAKEMANYLGLTDWVAQEKPVICAPDWIGLSRAHEGVADFVESWKTCILEESCIMGDLVEKEEEEILKEAEVAIGKLKKEQEQSYRDKDSGEIEEVELEVDKEIEEAEIEKELEAEMEEEEGLADQVIDAMEAAVEKKGAADLYDRTSVALSMLIFRSRGDFHCKRNSKDPPGNLELNVTRWGERYLIMPWGIHRAPIVPKPRTAPLPPPLPETNNSLLERIVEDALKADATKLADASKLQQEKTASR